MKFKKLLSTLVMLPTIAIPVATACSCNKVEEEKETTTYNTITFDANGGKIVSGNRLERVVQGSIFKNINKPTCEKDGYIFSGWLLDDDYKITNDHVIYANYTKIPEPEPEPVITEVFNLKDGVLYGFTEGVTIEFILSKFPDGRLIIPDCDSIADKAFDGKLPTFIDEVVIPTQLKSIGVNAFSNNSYLKKVEIQEGSSIENLCLKEIKDYAFYGTSITEFVMPPNLLTIGEYAFGKCEKLNYLDCTLIQECNLVSVASTSFMDINSKGEVYVRPATSNEWQAKLEKSGIKFNSAEETDAWSINEFTCLDIENGVCFGFKQDIPESLKYLVELESENLLIPSNVKILSNSKGGFQNNSYIKTLTISPSVVSIDSEMFKDCNNLDTINLNGFTSVPSWKGTNIFVNAASVGKVEILNSLRESWIKLFKETSGLTISNEAWVIGHEEVQVKNCVGVYAIEESTFTLDNGDNVDLECSLDNGKTWTKYSEPINIPASSYLLLKGNNPNGWTTSRYNIVKMSFTNGKVSLSGNVMGLLNNGDGISVTTIPCDYCFQYLFENCPMITSVSSDFLPATELTTSCYFNMFANCSSLVNCPDLPSSEMKIGCYESMFEFCTSLTKPPRLDSLTTEQACYKRMFYQCTNLEEVPELPSTSLTFNCYEYMFFGCKKIKYAPALPAATVLFHSYYGMFQDCTSLLSVTISATILAKYSMCWMCSGCTNLSQVIIKFTSWVDGATNDWLDDSSAKGIFICPTSLTLQYGVGYIPTDWTAYQI